MTNGINPLIFGCGVSRLGTSEKERSESGGYNGRSQKTRPAAAESGVCSRLLCCANDVSEHDLNSERLKRRNPVEINFFP